VIINWDEAREKLKKLQAVSVLDRGHKRKGNVLIKRRKDEDME